MTRIPSLLGALLLGLGAGAAHAHQGTVHEHGASRLDVVLDAGELQINLHGPAHNFVGFERPAQSDDEMQALHQARKKLNAGDRLFVLPAQAACALAKVELAMDTQSHHDHAGHEHHAHDAHAHHDWQAGYTFRCAHPQALRQVDVQVFAAFAQTESIRYQVMTPSAQTGGSLDAANTIMPLPQP